MSDFKFEYVATTIALPCLCEGTLNAEHAHTLSHTAYTLMLRRMNEMNHSHGSGCQNTKVKSPIKYMLRNFHSLCMINIKY